MTNIVSKIVGDPTRKTKTKKVFTIELLIITIIGFPLKNKKKINEEIIIILLNGCIIYIFVLQIDTDLSIRKNKTKKTKK